MDITTLDRVKTFLPGRASDLTSTDLDAVLNQFISGVSTQIEQYLDLKFEVKERTRFWDVEHPKRGRFFIDTRPLHSVTELFNDYDGEFDASTQLTESDDFRLDQARGYIIIDDYLLEVGYHVLKAVYVAGFAFGRDHYVDRINDGNTVTPNTGDIYLVGSAPTGAFAAASANQLATWDGATWTFADQTATFIANHPDIAAAADAQIAALFQKRGRIGAKYTAMQTSQLTYTEEPLIKEVVGMLSRHKRIAMF